MRLIHNIVRYTYPFYWTFKAIGENLGVINKNHLRVLIYHDIPESEESAFRQQLEVLAKRWNIISPEIFEAMVTGDELVVGRNLLISFDDGLYSNRTVAENVLQPMGIQAIFFVISDFVGIIDPEESKRYISDHLIPGSSPENIPSEWRNMQWKDLEYLVQHGHTIGCHTRTHRRLSDCHDDSVLRDELVHSADVIARRLSVSVKHFAFTFGDINSLSQESLGIAMQRYEYIHSGIRGDNKSDVSPFAIRRDAAAYQLPNNDYRLFDNRLIGAFLEGFIDFRYKAAGRLLDSWLKRKV